MLMLSENSDPPKKKQHILVDTVSPPTCSGSQLLLMEATSPCSLSIVWYKHVQTQSFIAK